MKALILLALLAGCVAAGCTSPACNSRMNEDHGPKPKRQRTILDLRGTHHVSQRALAHICGEIKTHGMVQAISRRTMLRTRRDFANRDTPFGKLIQERKLELKRGGCISLPFLHPAAMLWVCCEDCPEFKDFFSSVLRGQRLKVVMYTDEVTPGRELQAYNDKKLWVLYWSFLDFGPAALANEDAWLTGLILDLSLGKQDCGRQRPSVQGLQQHVLQSGRRL